MLRPVINITSAQLILQDGATPTIVSQSTIDEQTIGEDIGILGAPATLPTRSLLVDTGWTACAGAGGALSVEVPGQSHVREAPDAGFVVRSGGSSYVLAQAVGEDGTSAAYRYAIPDSMPRGDADNMLDQLGLLSADSAPSVSSDWLALFPAGSDLDWKSFGLDGFGQAAPGAGDASTGMPADAEVGDVVTVGDESLLLTSHGMAELDPFALAVYRHVHSPTGLLRDRSGTSRGGSSPVDWHLGQLPRVGRTTQQLAGNHWASGILTPEQTGECAVLDAAADRAPRVLLATEPTGDAAVAETGAPDRSISIASGRGAYVLSGDWQGTDGSPYVVDAKGVAYPLEGAEAASRLGYADHRPPVRPRLVDPAVRRRHPALRLRRALPARP